MLSSWCHLVDLFLPIDKGYLRTQSFLSFECRKSLYGVSSNVRYDDLSYRVSTKSILNICSPK